MLEICVALLFVVLYAFCDICVVVLYIVVAH